MGFPQISSGFLPSVTVSFPAGNRICTSKGTGRFRGLVPDQGRWSLEIDFRDVVEVGKRAFFMVVHININIHIEITGIIMIWYDMISYDDIIWDDAIQVWYGTSIIWTDMIWHDMTWYGMILYCVGCTSHVRWFSEETSTKTYDFEGPATSSLSSTSCSEVILPWVSSLESTTIQATVTNPTDSKVLAW